MRAWPVLTLAVISSCAQPVPPPAPAPAPAPAPHAGLPAWACTLGPLIGTHEIDAKVAPGVYRGEYQFSRAKFITMEHDISENVRGAARLTLAEDGSATGCLGVDDSSVGRVSEYASPDKQNHTYRSGSRSLLGVRGRWQASYDGVRLMIDHIGWKKCDAPVADMSEVPLIQLVCGTIAAGERLPTAALACRVIGNLPRGEPISFDLGDHNRAGPWAMHYDLTARTGSDLLGWCGPWLLLGAAPGLKVVSEEGSQSEFPTVTFTAVAPTFDESSYLDPPDAGVR